MGANSESTPSQWWQSQRRKYNIGLLFSGIIAFASCITILQIFGNDLRAAEVELTLFTVIVLVTAFIIVIGLANLFYFLGPLTEGLLKPRNPPVFRRSLFNLGFYFSLVIPFIAPALLIYTLLTAPVVDEHQLMLMNNLEPMPFMLDT